MDKVGLPGLVTFAYEKQQGTVVCTLVNMKMPCHDLSSGTFLECQFSSNFFIIATDLI